jgi:hypothetical protein
MYDTRLQKKSMIDVFFIFVGSQLLFQYLAITSKGAIITKPVVPMVFGLEGVHEICAIGTIFPDIDGKPRLHMHAALGREGKTRSGYIRPGIEVWKLGEVIVLEITENTAYRKENAEAGFSMLEP